jgi:23S rRNA (uracil1939-C5)-methyltransferase
MNNNETEYQVSSLDNLLMGVSAKNNKPLLIRGALPGEKATVINLGKQKGVLKASAASISDPNKIRISPKCSHSHICGGCGLQHISSQVQLELKQNIIKDQFKELANIENITFSPTLDSPDWGYRRKARLGVRYVAKKDRFLVGFREFNGRFLADIETCDILTPDVGYRLDKISDLLSQLSIGNKIPQIEVTAADNATALLVRHLADFSENDIKLWQQFGKEYNFHIYFQPSSYEKSHLVFPSEPESLYYDIPAHKLRMFFKVYDFIQINSEVNLKLIDKAIEWLEINDQDHILEGFCGIGNFSLPFAKYAQSVTAIEYCPSLLQDAAANASYNKLNNISFVADDLYNMKDVSSYAGNTKFNKLFLDPPRSGAATWLPTALSTKPELVVYVSCNSKTLAQDAAILAEHGYNLTNVAIANMFPHTNHVETIAKFKLKG